MGWSHFVTLPFPHSSLHPNKQATAWSMLPKRSLPACPVLACCYPAPSPMKSSIPLQEHSVSIFSDEPSFPLYPVYSILQRQCFMFLQNKDLCYLTLCQRREKGTAQLLRSCLVEEREARPWVWEGRSGPPFSYEASSLLLIFSLSNYLLAPMQVPAVYKGTR